MKKGFTLVELLGVIIVLGIIGLLAFPPIINLIRTERNNVSEATLKLIYSAAEKYMDENRDTYPIKEDTEYCISLQKLVDAGELTAPITDAQTGNNIPLNKEVYIGILNVGDVTYDLVDAGTCGYSDVSGAKAPELSDGMIPIVYNFDLSKWVKADVKKDWYGYEDQRWANAALIDATSRSAYKSAPAGTIIEDSQVLAYLVWIPRFRYRIFNSANIAIPAQEIKIVFEGSKTAKSNGLLNGEWLTHPAFTFGSIELNGFWVGKFETTGTSTSPTIKPNVSALRSQAISAQFITAQLFSTSVYGLTTVNDSHVIKNIEWGAVAYLSQSKYGKYGNAMYDGTSGLEKEIWINPNSNNLTGCAGNSVAAASTTTCNAYQTTNGVKTSTTGNIYGIYDMSGGSEEYVMGAQYNSGNTTLTVSSSGFSQATIDASNMSKYVDKYLYGTSTSDQAAYDRSIFGDAIGETRSWNGDYSRVIYTSGAWFLRGGAYSHTTSAGIYYSGAVSGSASSAFTFRTVILGD